MVDTPQNNTPTVKPLPVAEGVATAVTQCTPRKSGKMFIGVARWGTGDWISLTSSPDRWRAERDLRECCNGEPEMMIVRVFLP
jgi:hypothetical protein